MTQFLAFDGHNDLLSKRRPSEAVDAFAKGDGMGHLDAPRMRAGGLMGGLFAIYVPNPPDTPFDMAAMMQPSYDLPLPPQLSPDWAQSKTLEQAALLLRLGESGLLKVCTTAAEIEAAMHAGDIAAVMHIEGAEGLDPNLHLLDVLYAAGLRSLGPVWSRPNAFGQGVPFRFPSDSDLGPGLTDAGKALVKRCADLKIAVDTAHMTLKEFKDVATLSGQPIIASHSNAQAACQHTRNLSDDQLRMIGETKGIAGLNFATAFLREDGQMRADTPLSDMLLHLDHMLTLAGEDCVGLGSDFDGAVVPSEIKDCAGLPVLAEAMLTHGYGRDLVDKIFHKNWLRVLQTIWGA
ncbi:MAG: dipeptidase [Pseudomonadota bacterium]